MPAPTTNNFDSGFIFIADASALSGNPIQKGRSASWGSSWVRLYSARRERISLEFARIQNLQAGCLSALPVEQSRMHIFLLLELAASGSADKYRRLP